MFRLLFLRRQPDSANCRPTRRSDRRSTLTFDTLEAREVPATMTVNFFGDFNQRDNGLTLREAMLINTGGLSYNALTGFEKAQISGTVGTNDRIIFENPQSISLTSALPTLTKQLTIEGPGAAALTITGNGLYRAFNITSAGTVYISGLKLISCRTGTSNGGAVYNDGIAFFSRVSFESNGGATTYGGAIENNATLYVDECYFRNNVSAGLGGAIDNNSSATIANSTFAFNNSGGGGAIWSGGIGSSISNCSFDGNYSTANVNTSGGGAIRFNGGTSTITSCTFTNNGTQSISSGGAIKRVGGTVTMNNSVVAQNNRLGTSAYDDISGTVNGQFNVIGVNTGLSGISNNVNNNRVGTAGSPLDPGLENPADNGGFAPTQNPRQGSILLNGGASVSLAGIRDARGAGRAGAITIGALQVTSPLAPVGPSDILYGPGPIATGDEAFVKGLYRACLLRDADAGGLANWMNILSGHPERRFEVAQGFQNSPENRINQVTFYYKYFLDRAPDYTGLNTWVTALQSGVDESVVVRGFTLSQEFTGQNNNAQFVNKIYYAMLGRNPDSGGFSDWKNALDSGTLSRANMIDNFLRSQETVRRVVSGYFETYLAYNPSETQVTTWTNEILAGHTFGYVASAILGSQEFYNRGQPFVGV